jgi:hypothetical protein
LPQRQIVDVTEQPADRRAQAVQNTKRGAHWTPRSGPRPDGQSEL